MSGLISSGKLLLIEKTLSGFNVSVFDGHREMLKSLFNNGVIGDGSHSSPAHFDALVELEDAIAETKGHVRVRLAKEEV